jgi:hypothetical protein
MKKVLEALKGKKRYVVAAIAGVSAIAASLGTPIPAWVQSVLVLVVGQ